ncbi:Lcl C-terminal domain-containing protein [Faucicola boevrei]|uniref:Lcl C-terminal domain-containing protein n=1 Tax=Faucicola boevrei TaxID=346665 RepID=UPI000367B3A0|nr:DUF1566 domain-containing protein [Moraxella boevrei]
MQPSSKNLSLLAVAVSSAMALSACSNGNSVNKSHQTSNQQTPSVYEGRLIDAQIEGVTYKTATRTGVTDKNGKFFYDKMGEKIEFFVGNQNIGEAIATSEVHIYDIEPTISSRSDERKRYVERLAQTLQILDSDNNPENGIQLTDANRYKLEKILDVDVGSTSLQEILLKSPTEYVQDSLKKYAEEVGGFAKTWVSPEQANQHANRNKVCTSIADSTYYLPGVQDKFSTQGRTCREKAQAIAFYEDVALDIGSTAVQFHSDFLENTNEQTIHAGIKHAVESNIVANAIGATTKYMKAYATELPTTSTETRENAMKRMLGFAGNYVGALSDYAQTWQCSGKSDAECVEIKDKFKKTVIPAIFDALVSASECKVTTSQPNIDKCVEVVTKVLDASFEHMSNEQLKKDAKDITNIILTSFKSGANIARLLQERDATYNAMKIGTEMVDDIVKFTTGYNVRGDEESAVRNGWVNTLEITSEIMKTGGACAEALNYGVGISGTADCVENVTKFANQHITEIAHYSIAIIQISKANASLKENLTAQAFIAEYIRLGKNGNDRLCDSALRGCDLRGNSNLFFQTYANIPNYNQLNNSQKIRAWNSAIINIANKTDNKTLLMNPSKIQTIIELYAGSIATKSDQVLAGKAGSKATIELGNITSPQLIKYARPPKLTADSYRVDINKPIYFTATHKLDKSIIGYQISILGAENKTIYSDLPVLQYTFTKAGDYQLTMTPVIRKTNGGTFPIPAKSQTLAFNVLEDKTTKITNITTTPQQITTGQPFELIITGQNLPTDKMLTVNGCNAQTQVSLAVDKHIYQCTAPATATDNYNLSVVGTDGKTTIFNKQFKVTATTLPPITPTATKLTATGITRCGTERSSRAFCNLLDNNWRGLLQDGEVQAGQPMSYELRQYNNETCVIDKVTGLTWEQKTDDGGLRDKDNTYTWYNPDPKTNGGDAGSENNSNNTHQYIQQLNNSNYCGYSDWRLPNLDELHSIVDYSRSYPAIDPIFTYTQSNIQSGQQSYLYWSSSPHTFSKDSVWGVYFSSGYDYDYNSRKNNSHYVRAVR